MAVALGKRKRPEPKVEKSKKRAASDSPEPSDSEDLRDAFRRAFEAKFKPLGGAKKAEKKEPEPVEEDEDSSKDKDWEAISEEEDEGHQVEVVEVAGPTRTERVSKDELKAFMSSKPPSAAAASANRKQSAKNDGSDSDDGGEALALKNDLALQRLLKESHLLDASSLDGPSGKNRHKATDMRIQALGSKSSLLRQEKMPMAHRKGIVKKAADREDKRRREARENGIILEKARKEEPKKGADGKRRERGVGGPGVGRFSGGTLRLSKKDVASITGERRGPAGKKGKRR